MWLQKLHVDGLRNLQGIELSPGRGLTVIVGRNGQGKSSLLESIYMLATGRSFRTRKLDELVRWGGATIRIEGEVEAKSDHSRLKVIMHGKERRLMVNGAEKGLESYLGRLDLIDLTADRMHALKGSPQERRRFIDRGVVGLSPGYLRALGEYRRVLQQRNALLRGGIRSDAAGQLDAWDERLVAAAQGVHLRRREYLERLKARTAEIAKLVFPDGEALTLRYRCSPRDAEKADPSGFSSMFAQALRRQRETDQGVGFTTLGPHRDDLAVELEGNDLRKFGSAGQTRASMVALKLAKLELLKEQRGTHPLFLMDDFDADLDEIRARAVAESLAQGGFQTVVATSKISFIEAIGVNFDQIRMEKGVAHA